MLAPTVSASGPKTATNSPAWLAAKNSYRIISGIKPGQGKHGQAHPTILAVPLINARTQQNAVRITPYSYPPVSGEPSSAFATYGAVEYAAEPSDGGHPNLPDGTQYADDVGNTYNDYWYVTTCGAGAADVALFSWPWPPNYTTHSVVDTLSGAPTKQLTWKSSDGISANGTLEARTRGYMAYLAFGISNVPGWNGRKGLLPESYATTSPAQKGGSTLQAVEQVMNWEASGETSTGYFYVVAWNGSQSVSQIGVALHNDIVTDIASSTAPVVTEVKAGYLPDWESGDATKHLIAIVGYDDTKGVYYYIDTCQPYTGCHKQVGSSNHTTLLSIPQTTLTTAVAAIGTVQATGDGGWIW